MLPAVSPQSTGSSIPVIADAKSEARNATAFATSLGSAIRASGYQRIKVFRTCGSLAARAFQIGVLTVPGSTIFARIP